MTALPDHVRAILERPNYAHVATILPDGSPHSVPMWVGLEGDRISILTSPGSRKTRNLDRDPRISISISDFEQPNLMAQVRGRVSERIVGDEAWRIIDRMSGKYLGQAYPVREDRVVYLIEPESACGADILMSKLEPVAQRRYRDDDPRPEATWADGLRQLQAADTFWLATTRPDGRLHVMPLLAVALDGRMYFYAGP